MPLGDTGEGEAEAVPGGGVAGQVGGRRRARAGEVASLGGLYTCGRGEGGGLGRRSLASPVCRSFVTVAVRHVCHCAAALRPAAAHTGPGGCSS